MSSNDPKIFTQAPMGMAAVLATFSTLGWLQITRNAGPHPMDASRLSPVMWLGFFFVLWPASTYLARLLWKHGAGNPATAFLPVGCVLLAAGGSLNYAQYRQKSFMVDRLAQEIQRHADQNTFVASEEDYKKTRAEITSGGSLSAYRNLVFFDGALPMGIQRALGEVAVSGSESQRHELTTSYVSDYVLMFVIACHTQPSPEDLRTIYEYYNNSYAYNLRASKGQEHARALMCVATNSHTPPHILVAMLADPHIRTGDVLNNPDLPRPVLTEFLEREMRGDEQSRASVAWSSLSTVAMLERLASDPSSLVRRTVANNATTPDSILLKLADDQDPLVAVTANDDILMRLKEGDSVLAHRLLVSGRFDDGFTMAVACQKGTADADLMLIFKHFGDHPTDQYVHDSLVKCLDNHPHPPRDALLSLLH